MSVDSGEVAAEVGHRRRSAAGCALSVEHITEKVAATARTVPLSARPAASHEHLGDRPPPPLRAMVNEAVRRFLPAGSRHSATSEPEFSRLRMCLVVGIVGLVGLSVLMVGLTRWGNVPASAVRVPVVGPPLSTPAAPPPPAIRVADPKPTARTSDPGPRRPNTSRPTDPPPTRYQVSLDAANRAARQSPWQDFVPEVPGY